MKEVGQLFGMPDKNISDQSPTSATSFFERTSGILGYGWLFSLFAISEPGLIKNKKMALAVIFTGLGILLGVGISFPSGIVSGAGFSKNFKDLFGVDAPEWIGAYFLPQATNIAANALLAARVIQQMVHAFRFLKNTIKTQSIPKILWLTSHIPHH